ncbi:hypothetical protein HYS50_01045 [Candidatus Woesearchaeota archaeon]|nr:hypothetical protein [Candidatus Woesearchaeota archaeon]
MNILKPNQTYLVLFTLVIFTTLLSTDVYSEQYVSCASPWAIYCWHDNYTCANCEVNEDCRTRKDQEWTFTRFRDTCGTIDFVNFGTDPYLIYANLSWKYNDTSNYNWQNADVFIWKDDRPNQPFDDREACIHQSDWNKTGTTCNEYLTRHDKVVNVSVSGASLTTNADQWGNCGSAGGTGVKCSSPDIKSDIGQHASWEDDREIVILYLDPVHTTNQYLVDDVRLNTLRDQPPQFGNCPDSSTDEDSDATNISIDLWACHSDPDDPDAENNFTIISQSNQQLIDCSTFTNATSLYLNCSSPATDQNGINEIEIQVDDSYFTNVTNLTITVNSINDPPNFTVNTTASPDTSADAAEQGTFVLFKAQIDDNDEDDDVNFTICDGSGRSGTGCSGATYCNYNSTKDGWKSCSYDTSGLTSSTFSWTSFACDSSEACTDDADGTYTITRRPSEVKMDVGSHLQVFNGTGFFIGPERVTNFTVELQEELNSCVADAEGYCNITLTFTSNTAGKLNVSNLNIYTALNDTEPPQYDNLSVTPINGSPHDLNQIYEFNITYTDNVGVENVTINFNNTVYFYSEGNITRLDDIFTFNITGLAAAEYPYLWSANDSSGNENATDWFSYTVVQTPSEVNLTLNEQDSDIFVFINDTLVSTGYLLQGSGSLDLYINGTLVASGISPLNHTSSYGDFAELNVTLFYVGNENYTPSFETHFANVTSNQTLRVQNLTQLNATGLTATIGFDIFNELDVSLYTNWTLDFGDSNSRVNAIDLILNASETVFVFNKYTYGGAGTYPVTATAFNESYTSSQSINVTVV